MSGSPRPREPRMRANAISRPPTEPDPARTSSQVKDSPFDSVRRSQTPQTTMEFPDTEEVTGSNPVRPTRHFLFLALPGTLRGPTTALQRALLGPGSGQVLVRELARRPGPANGTGRLTR